MTHLSCLSEKQTSSSQESEGGANYIRPRLNRETSVPMLPAGSAKVFNVPFVSFLSGSVSL